MPVCVNLGYRLQHNQTSKKYFQFFDKMPLLKGKQALNFDIFSIMTLHTVLYVGALYLDMIKRSYQLLSEAHRVFVVWCEIFHCGTRTL